MEIGSPTWNGILSTWNVIQTFVSFRKVLNIMRRGESRSRPGRGKQLDTDKTLPNSTGEPAAVSECQGDEPDNLANEFKALGERIRQWTIGTEEEEDIPIWGEKEDLLPFTVKRVFQYRRYFVPSGIWRGRI